MYSGEVPLRNDRIHTKYMYPMEPSRSTQLWSKSRLTTTTVMRYLSADSVPVVAVNTWHVPPMFPIKNIKSILQSYLERPKPTMACIVLRPPSKTGIRPIRSEAHPHWCNTNGFRGIERANRSYDKTCTSGIIHIDT